MAQHTETCCWGRTESLKGSGFQEWFKCILLFKRFKGEIYDQLRECHRPKSVEISSFYIKTK